MAKEGEKAYRDRFEPVARVEVDRPNRRWHVDHTKADIMLTRSGRKPKRPWLTMVLDAYSRAPMGYYLSFDAPSTLSVSLALRVGILPKENPEWPVCGIPSEVFVDNGQDLISDHMKTVAADLRFELVPGSDGHARHNGRLERFNRTINTGLVCELPGYTGPNVTKRPEKVEPELTLREFEKRFRQWLVQEYMKSKNRTTKQTPLARWKSKEFVPRLPDSARQLDLLLVCDAKQRRITPEGIHLFTHTYVAQQLFPIIGEWVVVRYDPRDLEEVQVYFRDQWVGTARSVDPDHPYTDVREMRRLQRERRREVQQELRRYEECVSPAPKRRAEAKKKKAVPEPAGVGDQPKKKFYLYATDKLEWPE
jgi:putative transposase